MITVILVDDHSYIRTGIQQLLEAIGDIQVVATASNGIEAVAKARSHQPNVVIIDVSMPFMGGIEATKQIRAGCPRTRVLAISIYDHTEYVEAALQAGAQGYVLKDKIADELAEAIRALYAGQQFFSLKIASRLHPYSGNNAD